MSGSHNDDVSACEKKLGKEPPLPEGNNSILISENVAERLKTGTVKDERLENYDNYWMDKIACIDESHTLRNNLDLAEVEETLKRITKFTKSVIPKNTAEEKRALGECFAASPGSTLHCNQQVEEFVQEVDRLLYEAVRKDDQDLPTEKKMTYAEKFKRGYSS